MNPRTKLTIFVVEDNALFNTALKADIETTFENMNVKVHSFDTGEACMKMFEELKPEVMILDYNLNSKNPNAVDGIKVLDWIKKENHDTNVIILTSDDHIDIAVKAFQHGAADYVVKSETKFKKINYSIFNTIKVLEARSEARKYKRLATGLFVSIALIVIGVSLVQFFMPSLFH